MTERESLGGKCVVLLNGPPGSGKDTIADAMCAQWGYTKLKFADPLRAAVPAMLNVPQDTYDQLIDDQVAKNQATPRLLNMSPRELQIWLSEEVMKPKWGPRVFGELALNKIAASKENYFVISDSGFYDEAQVLLEALPGRVYLVRLYRDGHDFRGDSRSYIEIDAPTLYLGNNGTIPDALSGVATWLTGGLS